MRQKLKNKSATEETSNPPSGLGTRASDVDDVELPPFGGIPEEEEEAIQEEVLKKYHGEEKDCS